MQQIQCKDLFFAGNKDWLDSLDNVLTKTLDPLKQIVKERKGESS